MAKEEKGAKADENYEFLPPDFDEDQFIHREMVSFKTTAILFVWGIVAALASWAVFAAVNGNPKTGWLAGLAICAGFFLALKFLFGRFKADIKHWGRREWLGTGFLFFFTWLGIFIVAINPPVSDYAPPSVEIVVGPPTQQAGGLVDIHVFFEDNDHVASHTFAVRQDDLAIANDDALESLGRGHYRYTANLPVGDYAIVAEAIDDEGNANRADANFSVVPTVLQVTLPDGNTLDSPTDAVLVQVKDTDLPACATKKGRLTHVPCIRTVHLDRADGGRIILEHTALDGGWKATSNFAGWSLGDNVVNVTAEVVGTWEGSTFVHGGNLTAGPFTITVSTDVGTYAPKVISEPAAHARSVPGLGLPLLALGLLAAVGLARRR